MLMLFRALPLIWRLAAIAGLVVALSGAVGGAYLYIRHQGYVDGYAKARAECEAEKRAQEAANQKAIDESAKKLAEAEQQLELKELQLDDYLKALDLAVDAAPDSGDACLDVERVRRLGAIE